MVWSISLPADVLWFHLYHVAFTHALERTGSERGRRKWRIRGVAALLCAEIQHWEQDARRVNRTYSTSFFWWSCCIHNAKPGFSFIHDIMTNVMHHIHHFTLVFNAIWYSFRSDLSTSAGAPVRRSLPRNDFGNAITSLKLSAWHNNAISLSKPKIKM